MGRHVPRISALCLILLAPACSNQHLDTGVSPSSPPAVTPLLASPFANAAPEVLLAAGDVARCDGSSEQTARLLDGLGGTIAALGDLAYPSGAHEQFRDCYGPTWGRHRERTRPAPGNHDYETAGAAGYYDYFGALAGPRGAGYYSYQLGAWRVIVLNSNIAAGGGSAQLSWLRRELAAAPARCTLAYWHHPRFSSGPNGPSAHMADAWALLDEADAEVVLAGHDHIYERFAPQDAGGQPSPSGIRGFVVGTGGVPLYPVAGVAPNSERRISAHGILKLTLSPDSYSWSFIAVGGPGDSGSETCH